MGYPQSATWRAMRRKDSNFKMTKFPKIYSLSPGDATKYYWLNIIEEVAEGEHLTEKMKSGLYTFSSYSGTTEADCHGSTLALNFYSDRFVNTNEENKYSTFSKFKIDTQSELKTKGDYYFIQPNHAIPRVENQDIFSQPDLEKYCLENNADMKQLLVLSSQIFYLYADFGKWNGDDLFTIVGTTYVLVTDKIKLMIEKHPLKNIKFKEIPFLC